MKKMILLFSVVVIVFGLTASTFDHSNNRVVDNKEVASHQSAAFETSIEKVIVDKIPFFIGSRFATTITKEKLRQAKSVFDLVPRASTLGIEIFQEVKVAVLSDDEEKIEMGDGIFLNWHQLNLLQSIDYSNHFYVQAFYKNKNGNSGKIENQHIIYYITIVPEKEARFKGGQQALIDYLSGNIEDIADIDQDQLKSGKLGFTVSKEGEIAKVNLESTSGYKSIDNNIIERIKNMPRKWEAASNSKGEKVDQELVLSFGLLGC